MAVLIVTGSARVCLSASLCVPSSVLTYLHNAYKTINMQFPYFMRQQTFFIARCYSAASVSLCRVGNVNIRNEPTGCDHRWLSK